MHHLRALAGRFALLAPAVAVLPFARPHGPSTGFSPSGSSATTSPSAQEPAAAPESGVEPVTAEAVVEHYALLAHARYADALGAARELFDTVQAFLREPSEATFAATKRAWLSAHCVYSHTEPLRFGNPNTDAWEGRVNAWPMDEGLIDYVADAYVAHEGNPYARWNFIANGRTPIDEELIAEFQSGTDPKVAPTVAISDVETNVTRGYHAIEFLLWGQDLNDPPTSAGRRPFTDYVLGDAGTGGSQERRCDYLSAAAGLLVEDLRFALLDWAPDGELYSKTFAALPVAERLDRMIVGLGTMCFGEIASERMQVALITSDQEEEQSCFSDTTHHAHWHNIAAIESFYRGTHTHRDGTVTAGASLDALVRRLDADLADRLDAQFVRTRAAADELLRRGEAGEPFDRIVAADNESGRALVTRLMDELRAQTELLEEVHGRIADLTRL